MEKKYIYGAAFIVLGFIILSVLGVLKPFSVISPPTQVNIQGGEVYWSALISANNIKDGVGFNFAPSSTTLTEVAGSYPVGTKVTPTDSVIVYFSSKESSCSYQLTPISFGGNILANRPSITYYQLNSPVRSLKVDVCADSDCKVLDALNIGAPIEFTANGGKLVVTAQGGLMGAQDCPTNANVAVYKTSDNRFVFYNEAQFKDAYSSYTWVSFTNLDNYLSTRASKANVFTQGFGGNIPSVDQGVTKVTGEMPMNLLGSGTVLLTANAKYFASTFVVPPETCTPKIDSISVSDIQQDGQGTASVKISADKICALNVESSTERSSITPKTQTLAATTSSKTLNYIVKCNAGSGADAVKIKACSSNDYTGLDKCDSETKAFNCIQEEPTTNYCGDGTCDSNIGENSATCSKDCKTPITPDPDDKQLDCSIYGNFLVPYTPVMTAQEKCTLGFINCRQVINNGCEANYTLLIVIIILAIIGGLTLYFVKRKK
jgi:hypothetical protein